MEGLATQSEPDEPGLTLEEAVAADRKFRASRPNAATTAAASNTIIAWVSWLWLGAWRGRGEVAQCRIPLAAA